MNIIKASLNAVHYLKYLFALEGVSVIIPCHNEEKSVGKVIAKCFESQLVNEVIVVDDGSVDNSVMVAKTAGAKVVRHLKNKGKGAAIMTGCRAAHNSVLVFIDADFENMTPKVVETLAFPVLEDEAKLCKATFDREGGRVTELTAKPLLEFIFPEVTLQQPLSGQFATRKEFLIDMENSPGWGIDVGIVLESIKLGEKIVEVNIGRVEHKHRSLEELSKTAKEVTKTILQNAGFLAKKHKLIIFDFDKTLVQQSSIELIAKQAGFSARLEKERKKYYSGKISERELTFMLASVLKGLPTARFKEIAAKTKKMPFADETLTYLRRMGHRLVVVSFAYGQIITSCFNQNLFDEIISPVLEEKGGRFTGKVAIPRYRSKGRNVFCKGKAVRAVMRRLKIKRDETIAVGDSAADEEMFAEVGLPVAINFKRKNSAVFNIKSLPELLTIAG
ncbi:MAG: HAD-IB family phosphatase [Candidatus Micrarchaeota archaeon]